MTVAGHTTVTGQGRREIGGGGSRAAAATRRHRAIRADDLDLVSQSSLNRVQIIEHTLDGLQQLDQCLSDLRNRHHPARNLTTDLRPLYGTSNTGGHAGPEYAADARRDYVGNRVANDIVNRIDDVCCIIECGAERRGILAHRAHSGGDHFLPMKVGIYGLTSHVRHRAT